MRVFAIPVAVLISGLLFLLALPPADLHYLAWLAFVPLFLAVGGRGFAVGFAAGLGVCLVSMAVASWGLFYPPNLPDGNPSWIYLGFALFGLAVGLLGGLAGETKTLTVGRVLLYAAWGVLFEAAMLVYMPAHVALTQYQVPGALLVASAAGIWGVSFLVWAVNLLIAHAVAARRLRVAGAAALVPIALWAVPWSSEGREGDYTVAAIQTEAFELEDLARLNRRAGDLGADFAVWPELSGMVASPGGDTGALVALAAEEGQPPFATSFQDGVRPMPHNAAALFSGDGESARYLKRKPFGAESQMHRPGKQPVAIQTDQCKVGLNICYDTCFPHVMRDTVRRAGAEIILLPNMDPVSPRGVVQALHAAYTPFRAAELGVPIVRADITAHSMIVDGTGRILARAASGTEEVIVERVNLRRGQTLYLRLGDWFLYFCAAVAVAGLVRIRFGRTSGNRG
ncbi:MAG: hypothetical protein IH851_03030 [Armatimonadetes bacterium]|nr:hypothetical protein [Armatimonadota bacterium]